MELFVNLVGVRSATLSLFHSLLLRLAQSENSFDVMKLLSHATKKFKFVFVQEEASIAKRAIWLFFSA